VAACAGLQDYLLPPSPRDWLPANHLVFLLLDLMATLDLREVERAIHAKDARGTRPYDPRRMTALLLYGYCVGLASSRKLEQATYTDVACREDHGVDPYLSVGRQPHGGADGKQLPAESACKRAMRAKLRTTAGQATCARRKAVVEPAFGQIEEARGFRRMLLRGTVAVRAEWALICSGHNLLKLFGVVWPHARRAAPAFCAA
jgi:hypothetical protein